MRSTWRIFARETGRRRSILSHILRLCSGSSSGHAFSLPTLSTMFARKHSRECLKSCAGIKACAKPKALAHSLTTFVIMFSLSSTAPQAAASHSMKQARRSLLQWVLTSSTSFPRGKSRKKFARFSCAFRNETAPF